MNEQQDAWLDEFAAAVRDEPVLTKDSRRCEALLRDLLPGDGHRANVIALKLAVEQAIPSLLEDDRARGEKLEHSLARRTKNFENATGLSTRMAEWAVRAWSVAIGWGTSIPTMVSREKAVAGSSTPSAAAQPGADFDMEACILSAERGSASSQRHLGDVYSEGRGVPRDDALAVEWYRKAAEQGDASAQNNLGWMYQNGRGVARDDALAVEWYRKAAEQGNAAAQFNLGVRYENGRGVAKDDAAAVEWYHKAAEQGDADAQNNLGVMYEDGRGVARDDATAAKWYRKAAEQGYATAQYNLGVMYRKGRGVGAGRCESR